jgi:hypothetical protein
MLSNLTIGTPVALLLLCACAAEPAATEAYSGPSWFDRNGVLHGFTAPRAPVPAATQPTDQPFLIPRPEVPQVAPPIDGSPGTRAPYAYQPGPAPAPGGYGLPLNPGPVTNYGPGGLAQPPGAPSNPPFHF